MLSAISATSATEMATASNGSLSGCCAARAAGAVATGGRCGGDGRRRGDRAGAGAMRAPARVGAAGAGAGAGAGAAGASAGAPSRSAAA